MMSALQHGSVPKHEQLRGILRIVATEQLQAGDPVPSERALMAAYGVSRVTVREAIGQLVNDGVLVRVHGKGTFVANRTVRSRLHLASFTEEMRAQGYVPSTVVLQAGRAVAPSATARALGIAEGASAIHLKRLRLADGRPVSVDDAWYDGETLAGLLEIDLSGSVYRALADRFGRPIDRAEQTVGADPAPGDIATLLGIDAGAPVLHFDRVSFSATAAIEHAQSWYRSDRYRLQMEVRAPA
ncbi:GntR family transcriptional regulator [Microbacteriaceae bacterium VKM Ac-2854]|nr:GntR family transcriptional regulator [Microbacteriaceae bacterium VKM Ac-2854]